MDKQEVFKLHLRIPGWLGDDPIHGDLYRYCDNLTTKPKIEYNGEEVKLIIEKGYAVLENEWKNGDTVELTLPLYIRRVISHPAVEQNIGKVALQRGPVLYCAEGNDNGGEVLMLSIPDSAELNEQHEPSLLGGVHTISGTINKYGGEGGKQLHKLLAIPYFAWSNRGENEMIVWFKRD